MTSQPPFHPWRASDTWRALYASFQLEDVDLRTARLARDIALRPFAVLLRRSEDRSGDWGLPPRDPITLRAAADAAYARCAQWFGSPPDLDLPYVIRSTDQRRDPYCSFNRWTQRYTIVVPNHLEPQVRRRVTIAHEMYHRTTMRRSGVHRQMWLEEMLAHAASHRFLEEQGCDDDVEVLLQWAIRRLRARIDASSLKRLERKPGAYPEGFTTQVQCLGKALLALVDWDDICRIVGSQSLDDWLDTLASGLRAAVCRVLTGVAPDSGYGGDPATGLKLADALYWIGEPAAAAGEIRLVLGRCPSDAEAHRQLGRALLRLGRPHESLAEFGVARSLGMRGHRICANLAAANRACGSLDLALVFIDCAVAERPRSALLHNQRGIYLRERGDLAGARIEWERTIAMDPAGMAGQFAARSLFRYPLPGMLHVKPRRKFAAYRPHIST